MSGDRSRPTALARASFRRRAIVAGLAAFLWASSCEHVAPPVVEVIGDARVLVTPHPPRVGRVGVQLDLPPEFLPDPHFGKRVSFSAQSPNPSAQPQQGEALESRDVAHRFTFEFDADCAGVWRVSYEATWPDGRPFDSGRILLRDVR